MKDPNKFTVAALKELLMAQGLPSTGAKAELFSRLMEADPSGAWMDGELNDDDDDTGDSQRTGATSAQLAVSQLQREADLYKKEKELAERELAVVRLELEAMRRMGRTERVAGDEWRRRVATPVECEQAGTTAASSDGGYDIAAPFVQSRMSITAIADLLGTFDGESNEYETWERQIKLLTLTYKLEDNVAKILVGMRLKGKALEWLHSKSEHITMMFDRLLDELRAMFCRRQSKLVTQKKFEERRWRREETFHEYYHEKVIMGNRVPIDDDDILEYVIEGRRDASEPGAYSAVHNSRGTPGGVREGDSARSRYIQCIEINEAR